MSDSLYRKLYEDSQNELNKLRREHQSMLVTLQRIRDTMSWFEQQDKPTFTSPLKFSANE